MKGKTLDVITLFHKPSLPASARMLALLQRASTKAGDPAQRVNLKRGDWELEVTENHPTPDQVRSMLEYIGAKRAGEIVNGAKDGSDAMQRFEDKPSDFVWPMVRPVSSTVKAAN